MNRTRLCFGTLLVATALTVASGCGSNGSGDAEYSSAPARPSSTTPSTPAISPDDGVSTDGQAVFAASLGSGDAVSVNVDFGEPLARNDISNSAVAACDDEIDADRSAVIPVRLTGELTSSMEASVSVDPLAGWLDDADQPDIYWAASFSDSGPTCNSPAPNGSVFGVRWNNLQPGSTRSLTAYLILDGALSPNDPTGADITKSVYVIPRIEINGDLLVAGTGTVSGTGDRVMRCDGVGNMGIYIAAVIDREIALADGCTESSS